MELFRPEELCVEVWPPRKLGGQHVGTAQGVRITHIASGITVTCDHERSQHRNKAIAIAALEGAITCPMYR